MTENAAAAQAGMRVTPGRWIGMAWAVIKDDLGNFILIALIATGLIVAVSFTVVGSIAASGPLLAGMFIAVRRRMLEGRFEVMDVFAGFNYFLDAFLISLLTSLFLAIGMVLCVFPFFIIGALYLFPLLFVIDRKLGFWDAMEASRKLAMRDLPGFVMFMLLLCLLNLLGLALAGIGLLVTVPVSLAAVALAYKEIVGFQPHAPETRGPVIIP